MRVISGEKKGHKLIAPKGENTRPTEDRVKENVFNILGPIKEGAIVLDLFAGSGGVGIEFLSRGAEFCYFIDSSQKSVDTINHNLEHTKLTDKSMVIRGSALKLLDVFAQEKLKFDYVYIDPPFDNIILYKRSIQNILLKDLLKRGGLIIVESSSHLNYAHGRGLNIIDERIYGNTKIGIYNFEV